MIPGRRRTRGRASGQTLAEFAIVAPIFFLLVFSVLQLGLVFGAQNGLVDGVRDAARRAATYRVNELSFDSTTKQEICDAIDQELVDRLQAGVPGFDATTRLARTVTYEWELTPSSGEYNLIAHITATYDHPLYVPLISFFLDRSDGVADDQLTLTATEQMRVENPSIGFTSTPTDESCPPVP